MSVLFIGLVAVLGLSMWACGVAAFVSFWVGVVMLVLNLAGIGSVDADTVWLVWKYWGGFLAAALGCGLSILISGIVAGTR